ncbi:hypothetical protein G6F42_010585 [Rhizopus arrhizus]|nr:hypothetical protein G6F42_010585 [Rhizopus arrhizus]
MTEIRGKRKRKNDGNPTVIISRPEPRQEPKPTLAKQRGNKIDMSHMRVKKAEVWGVMQETPAPISMAQWITTDRQAGDEVIAGIRHSRRRKREPLPMVHKAEIDSSSESDSSYDDNSNNDRRTNSITTSSTYSSESEAYTNNTYELEVEGNESVYGYVYDLENMKSGTPLRADVEINGQDVSCVCDSGASLSIIGSGLAQRLGLVPNGDTINIIGIQGTTTSGSQGNGIMGQVIMNVPISIGGRIRPEHMVCIGDASNDTCILGVPFFKQYGIEFSLEDAIIKVPALSAPGGMVFVQGYIGNNRRQRPANEVFLTESWMSYEDDTLEQGVKMNKEGINLGNVEGLAKKAQRLEECDNFPTSIESLTTIEDPALVDLIKEYEDVFVEISGLGRVKNFEVELQLKPGAVVNRGKPYRLTWAEEEQLEKDLKELIKLKLIEPSDGRIGAPLFFVDKKGNQKLRLVCNYRHLNDCLEDDVYPLPNIEDCLSNFDGARYFSSIDAAFGYWQIPLSENSKYLTGVVCNSSDGTLSTFNWTCLPFGVKVGSQAYSRCMDMILGDCIKAGFAKKFIDDCLVYSKTLDDHKKHLKMVFEALKKYNLRLKGVKCQFGSTHGVEFLGHRITADGVLPLKYNVDKMLQLKVPTNKSELMSALGMFGYYRKFIKDYSSIVQPLTVLTRKKKEFEWHDKQQTAFDMVLTLLTSDPILAFPDRKQIQIVTCDASYQGLGCVLSQSPDGKPGQLETVVAYASQSISQTESNYAITHLEALSLVWGVLHFKQYLKGRKFVLITDHAALRFIFSPSKSTPKICRWLSLLMDYDYDVQYKSGKKNPADGLSRLIKET